MDVSDLMVGCLTVPSPLFAPLTKIPPFESSSVDSPSLTSQISCRRKFLSPPRDCFLLPGKHPPPLSTPTFFVL